MPEAVPQPWTAPQPRELPALREALADQMRSPFEHQRLTSLLSLGLGTHRPRTGNLARDAVILLREEHQRLSEAVLYFVTADMTRLAMAAAQTLPLHTFHAEDVPAESGFMVFEEPIAAYFPDDVPNVVRSDVVTVVAASWGHLGSVDGKGIWVTFWSITDYERDADVLRQQEGVSASEARRIVQTRQAELTWDNEVTMPYGAHSMALHNSASRTPKRVEKLDTNGKAWSQVKDNTLAWANIARAAWLLMTQPGVVDVEEQHTPRTVRRRMERAGHNAAPVRVVHIHHRANVPTASESGQDGRSYSVRWTVRGHWRNQWYPSREEHRPVWINPHIKGPEDAPFHTRGTVHVLNKPTS